MSEVTNTLKFTRNCNVASEIAEQISSYLAAYMCRDQYEEDEEGFEITDADVTASALLVSDLLAIAKRIEIPGECEHAFAHLFDTEEYSK